MRKDYLHIKKITQLLIAVIKNHYTLLSYKYILNLKQTFIKKRKFLIIDDVVFFNTPIFSKDETIEVDDVYQVDKDGIKFPLSIKDILVDKRFKEVIEPKQELKFEVQELTEDEDLEVKRYRIQLDVVTNRKKLREIENFMRKTLEEML